MRSGCDYSLDLSLGRFAPFLCSRPPNGYRLDLREALSVGFPLLVSTDPNRRSLALSLLQFHHHADLKGILREIVLQLQTFHPGSRKETVSLGSISLLF